MTLSAEQLQAISEGEAVELTIKGTHCVVLRHDLYERVKRVIEPSPRDTYPAVLKALDKFDETPEQYLEYLND
ncbi:MAG: hypothetical protein WD851_23890 [Pirellulales bacterium]